MQVIFPTALDTFDIVTTEEKNKFETDAKLREEDIPYFLYEIEKKIGEDNSTDTTSIDYRIATLEGDKIVLENKQLAFWDKDKIAGINNLQYNKNVNEIKSNALILIQDGKEQRAQIRLEECTTPTTLNEGDIWNDTTQKTFIERVNNLNSFRSSATFIKTDTTTIVNTTAETSILGQGIGGKNCPTNLVAGKSIRITASGYYIADPADNCTLRIISGAGTFITSVIPLSSAENSVWKFELLLTFRNSTQAIANGYFQRNETSGDATPKFMELAVFGTPTNFSGSIDISMQWDNEAELHSISATNILFEVLA